MITKDSLTPQLLAQVERIALARQAIAHILQYPVFYEEVFSRYFVLDNHERLEYEPQSFLVDFYVTLEDNEEKRIIDTLRNTLLELKRHNPEFFKNLQNIFRKTFLRNMHDNGVEVIISQETRKNIRKELHQAFASEELGQFNDEITKEKNVDIIKKLAKSYKIWIESEMRSDIDMCMELLRMYSKVKIRHDIDDITIYMHATVRIGIPIVYRHRGYDLDDLNRLLCENEFPGFTATSDRSKIEIVEKLELLQDYDLKLMALTIKFIGSIYTSNQLTMFTGLNLEDEKIREQLTECHNSLYNEEFQNEYFRTVRKAISKMLYPKPATSRPSTHETITSLETPNSTASLSDSDIDECALPYTIPTFFSIGEQTEEQRKTKLLFAKDEVQKGLSKTIGEILEAQELSKGQPSFSKHLATLAHRYREQYLEYILLEQKAHRYTGTSFYRAYPIIKPRFFAKKEQVLAQLTRLGFTITTFLTEIEDKPFCLLHGLYLSPLIEITTELYSYQQYAGPTGKGYSMLSKFHMKALNNFMLAVSSFTTYMLTIAKSSTQKIVIINNILEWLNGLLQSEEIQGANNHICDTKNSSKDPSDTTYTIPTQISDADEKSQREDDPDRYCYSQEETPARCVAQGFLLLDKWLKLNLMQLDPEQKYCLIEDYLHINPMELSDLDKEKLARQEVIRAIDQLKRCCEELPDMQDYLHRAELAKEVFEHTEETSLSSLPKPINCVI